MTNRPENKFRERLKLMARLRKKLKKIFKPRLKYRVGRKAPKD
jgi:hypothetical protein